MSFLKKLFGGGSSSGIGSPKAVAEVEYEGFKIATTPIEEGGQFRVCALVSKAIDGEVQEHKLIRADMCGSADEASEIALRKAKMMIDERGDRIFES